MDYSKYKLKELISIVRKNKKSVEAAEFTGKKDIRYSNKKSLISFLQSCNDIQIDDPEVKDVKFDIPEDDEGYVSSELEPKEKNDDEVIELNLEKIKNKKVRKSKEVLPPVESQEDIIQKKEAMSKINAYLERFSWLRYERIDMSDPIAALDIVECKLSIKNSNPAIARQFFNACYGIEYLVTASPINDYVKLQGLSRNLETNKDIRDTVDELLIKYSPSVLGGNISPEYRLGLLMLTVAVSTHISNNTEQEPEKNIDINKPVGNRFKGQ